LDSPADRRHIAQDAARDAAHRQDPRAAEITPAEQADAAKQLQQEACDAEAALKLVNPRALAVALSNTALLSSPAVLKTTEQLLLDTVALFTVSAESVDDDMVSDMAVLALHVFFALTDYGTKMRPRDMRKITTLCKPMCDFLLAHLQTSRQPESFCEGLILLHYCGYGAQADELMREWHDDKKKIVYPAVLGDLPCFAGFSKPRTKGDRQLSDMGARVLHYHVLLRYLAQASSRGLPSMELPPPRERDRASGVRRGNAASSPSASTALAAAASSASAAGGSTPSSNSFEVQVIVFPPGEQQYHHALTPVVTGQHTSDALLELTQRDGADFYVCANGFCPDWGYTGHAA